MEASAFMGLTLDRTLTIQRRHHGLAKIAREEVARPFRVPMPVALPDPLVARNERRRAEADRAARIDAS